MNRITLKLYRVDNKKPHTYTSTKTKRIYSKIRHEDFSKALLKVTYTPTDINEGIYFNKQELLQALDAFLEVKSG